MSGLPRVVYKDAIRTLHTHGRNESSCTVSCITRSVTLHDFPNYVYQGVTQQMLNDTHTFVCETHEIVHQCRKNEMCPNQVSDAHGNMCCPFSGIPRKMQVVVHGYDKIDVHNENDDHDERDFFNDICDNYSNNVEARRLEEENRRRTIVRTKASKKDRLRDEDVIETQTRHGSGVHSRPVGDYGRMTIPMDVVRKFVSHWVYKLFLDGPARSDVAGYVLDSMHNTLNTVRASAIKELKGEGEIVSHGVLYPVRVEKVMGMWIEKTNRNGYTMFLVSAAYSRITRIFDAEMARLLVRLICDLWSSIDVMIVPAPNTKALGDVMLAIMYQVADGGIKSPDTDVCVQDDWVLMHIPPRTFLSKFSTQEPELLDYMPYPKCVVDGINAILVSKNTMNDDKHMRTISMFNAALSAFNEGRRVILERHSGSDFVTHIIARDQCEGWPSEFGHLETVSLDPVRVLRQDGSQITGFYSDSLKKVQAKRKKPEVCACDECSKKRSARNTIRHRTEVGDGWKFLRERDATAIPKKKNGREEIEKEEGGEFGNERERRHRHYEQRAKKAKTVAALMFRKGAGRDESSEDG